MLDFMLNALYFLAGSTCSVLSAIILISGAKKIIDMLRNAVK